MRIIFGKCESFTGADKRAWVRAPFITDKGETGEYFTSKEQFDALKIPKDFFLEKEFAEFFESNEGNAVDAEYNKNGRLIVSPIAE